MQVGTRQSLPQWSLALKLDDNGGLRPSEILDILTEVLGIHGDNADLAIAEMITDGWAIIAQYHK